MSHIAGIKNKSPESYPQSGGGGLGLLNALGNYASIVNATPAATPAGPTSYTVAAIVVKPQSSGIFRVNVDIGWFDSGIGDQITWSLLAAEADPTSSNITLTGGTPAAIVGSTADASTTGQVTAGSAPIGLVNANPTLFVLLSSKQSESETGSGQQQNFDVNGIFSNAGAGTTKVPVPFTLGVDCVFYLQVNTTNGEGPGVGPIANMKLQFTVQENPLP